MTGKICYKVVTQDKQSIIIPKGSKFSLKYNKGIVTALSETIGILVFENLFDAVDFLSFIGGNGKIIKVRPIGKMKPIPSHIAITYHDAYLTTQSIKSFNQKHCPRTLPTPQGTQCYGAVEVLE